MFASGLERLCVRVGVCVGWGDPLGGYMLTVRGSGSEPPRQMSSVRLYPGRIAVMVVMADCTSKPNISGPPPEDTSRMDVEPSRRATTSIGDGYVSARQISNVATVGSQGAWEK